MGYGGKLQIGLTANGIHEDWHLQVARGDLNGILTRNIFGRNLDGDVSTAPEDIWSGGGNVNWPSAAAQINVSSSSANDTAAGTGARTLFFRGLNENWDIVDEIVELNGQTIVQTQNSYIRINRISVETVGSGLTAAGEIYAFSGTATSGVPDTATSIWRQIPAGSTVCQCAFYSVPRNYEAYVYFLRAQIRRGTGSTAWCNMQLQVRDNAGQEFGVTDSAFVDIRDVEATNQNPALLGDTFPIKIPEYADFKVRAVLGSVNNLVLTAQANFLLVQKRIDTPPFAQSVI